MGFHQQISNAFDNFRLELIHASGQSQEAELGTFWRHTLLVNSGYNIQYFHKVIIGKIRGIVCGTLLSSV